MLKNIFVILLFAFSTCAHSDELVEVPSPETGFFANTDPTKIMLWDDEGTKNIVVFFPGGDGNFKMERVWRRTGTARGIGGTVTIIPNTSGAFVNSPYPLGLTHQASGRWTDEHLNRMISALEVIKQKTNKNIWVYGHSNGSISAFEVYSRLQKQNKTNLVNGIIVSGARDIVKIPETINVPVLFIHHRDDACFDTPLHTAQQNFNKVKSRSTAKAEFVTMTSYIPPAGHPCLTGVHMFDGKYDELAQIINSFVNQ